MSKYKILLFESMEEEMKSISHCSPIKIEERDQFDMGTSSKDDSYVVMEER